MTNTADVYSAIKYATCYFSRIMYNKQYMFFTLLKSKRSCLKLYYKNFGKITKIKYTSKKHRNNKSISQVKVSVFTL